MKTFTAAETAVRVPSQHTLWPVKPLGNTSVDRAVLFAGHAECASCHAFVRQITRLGAPSVIGEVVAGWCSVCSTTTYFAPTS